VCHPVILFYCHPGLRLCHSVSSRSEEKRPRSWLRNRQDDTRGLSSPVIPGSDPFIPCHPVELLYSHPGLRPFHSVSSRGAIVQSSRAPTRDLAPTLSEEKRPRSWPRNRQDDARGLSSPVIPGSDPFIPCHPVELLYSHPGLRPGISLRPFLRRKDRDPG
jgi:hypothetical protein